MFLLLIASLTPFMFNFSPFRTIIQDDHTAILFAQAVPMTLFSHADIEINVEGTDLDLKLRRL
jgi:hypothetical protein